MGKVGEVAVVAGVGAAVFMGLGCAVASADDDAGAAASASSTDTGAGPARTTDEPGTRDDRSDEETSQDDPAREESADEADNEETEEALSPNEIPQDAPIEGADEDPQAAEETDPPATVIPEDTAEDDSTVVVPVDSAETSSAAPKSSVDIDPGPAPAAFQPLWTFIGSARREPAAEAAAPTAHATLNSITTSEVLDAAPATSIVYTEEPTLFDRMVVASLRAMRVVSNLVGIDVYGLFAKVLEREKPPWFVRHGLDVRRTEYEVSDGSVWVVWEFHPPDPTGKTVMAVHGGGFVVQPLITHWGDYSAMARTTGATVIVPMYPLATTEAGSASKVVPAMAELISDQIAVHGAENVSVYADSAGTILAMSAVRQLVLDGHPVPASMVLLSTAPDASLSNPAVREIRDPVIDVDNLDFYRDGGHWAEGFDPRDPMVSPLFIEDAVLAGFPPTTIYIGTLEIGLPDTLLLHEKWNAAGGEVSLVIGQGQIHDWALGGSINSQASEVRPDIYLQLGLNGVAAGPQTIVTEPPSLWDRLVLRTLQRLRRNSPGLFAGDPSGLTGTNPPAFVRRGLIVSESEYNGWTVWELAPETRSGEYVLALHGGGFVAEANVINWADYAALARDTGATVLVPIYPLAPPVGTGTVPTLVPPMADYLSMLIDVHGAENVSLYGDSAGGTFAMLTAQELVRRCRSDVQCVLSEAQPSRMVLISPILHLTLSGPIVDDIDDPIIPRPQPGVESPDITGGLDVNDPRVNPIAGEDLTGLPPTAVYIGTIERPYPGNLQFRDKLLGQDPDADFTVIIGDGQMHDWALGGIFVNSQAPLWRSTIYRQLGLLPGGD